MDADPGRYERRPLPGMPLDRALLRDVIDPVERADASAALSARRSAGAFAICSAFFTCALRDVSNWRALGLYSCGATPPPARLFFFRDEFMPNADVERLRPAVDGRRRVTALVPAAAV